MPKGTKKASSKSPDQPRACPYTKKSEHVNLSDDEKEWDKVRCPICLDRPHNPVLLVCSSHGIGCRPYLCHTSPLLSNCLDQFRKSPPPNGLSCPFCRGPITKDVTPSDQAAVRYMNSRPRSCPNESCDFYGTHEELMEHARTSHDGKISDVAVPSTTRPAGRGARMSVGGYYPRRQLAPRTILPRVS